MSLCSPQPIYVAAISLNFPLSADPNITDLLQREYPQILAGIGMGYGNTWLRAYKTGNISETVCTRVICAICPDRFIFDV